MRSLSPILKVHCANLLYFYHRTLVFVEGDATMRQWENAEGKKQTALNITQRTSSSLNLNTMKQTTYFSHAVLRKY